MGSILECGAHIIDKKIPLIGSHFGVDCLDRSLKLVLDTIDKLTNPLFNTFLEHNRLMDVVAMVREF